MGEVSRKGCHGVLEENGKGVVWRRCIAANTVNVTCDDYNVLVNTCR